MAGFGERVAKWIVNRAFGAIEVDDGSAFGYSQPHGQPPRRGSRELLTSYSRSPRLRALVERTSDGVASLQWQMFAKIDPSTKRVLPARGIQALADHRERSRALDALAGKGELVEITDHPLLDFIADPMPTTQAPYRLAGRAFMKFTVSVMDLMGDVAWILQRNGAGMPVGAMPVPGTWIVNPPAADRPTFRIRMGQLDWEVPVSEVVWFRSHDPANPFGRGTGLGLTVADEIETDEYAAKHLKAWFWNSAMPAGFVGFEGAKQSELERVKERWENEHRGFWRSWRMHFHSGKLTWQPVQQTFEQQQMSQLRKDERDIMMHTWGCPPELLGIVDKSNRATIDASDFLFNSKLVVPRAEDLRSTMQVFLVPQFDARAILHYRSPVAEDKEFVRKVLVSAPWSLTRNEIRELAGKPKTSDPTDDVLPPRPDPTTLPSGGGSGTSTAGDLADGGGGDGGGG